MALLPVLLDNLYLKSTINTPQNQSFNVGGNVVKGPLSNALVFLDSMMTVYRTDEPSIRTDADRGYSISTTNATYSVVAIADDSTIDTSSGTVLTGVTLKAPKGASVITPTTTLMKESNLTAEDVASVLSLPDGVDPLTFNPYGAGVDAAKALAVEKVSQQVMSVVNSFAAAAEGAGASKTDAFKASMKSFVEVIKTKATSNDKTIDLTNSTDLDLIKNKVATEVTTVSGVNTTAFNTLASDTTTAIKNVNDKIKPVTDLSSDSSKNVFATTQVLKDQIKTAVTTEVSSAGTGGGSLTFKNSSAVDTASANKAPTDISLSSLSITENANSLVIGTLTTTDSDQPSGRSFDYRIAELPGTDYNSFSINQSTGELSLKASPNYEAKSSYKLTILSKDDGGKIFSKSFSVSVTNINEAPTISSTAVTSATEDSNYSYTLIASTLME